MGKRDYRHREPKKQKKDAHKIAPAVDIIQTPTQVEVIKKGKKKREGVEEEEG